MASRVLETLVGAAVLAIAAAALGYALTRPQAGGAGYDVFADFADASGVRPGTRVEIAGVRVGQVAEVTLTDAYFARARLRIDAGVAIPEDSELAWRQSDLIGAPSLSILVFDLDGTPLQDGDFFSTVDPADNFFELLSSLARQGAAAPDE